MVSSGEDKNAGGVEPAEDDGWEQVEERRLAAPGAGGGFHVDVEGFEGPLDLMLSLARTHKLDLTRISILYLAEQYLDYIEKARQLRLDVAADYLVMAAWLTFLKSKLLLPADTGDEDEPTGEELAAQLALRLQQLDAMREAAAKLMDRPRLGLDFFPRGQPEGIRLVRKSQYEADIYDLLAAYASGRLRNAVSTVRPTALRHKVWSIKQAWVHLERLVGADCRWAPIDALLAEFLSDPKEGRTALAATFGAALEMAREGQLELQQSDTFAPLYLRGKGKET
jgi:segregation and condensation protein A